MTVPLAPHSLRPYQIAEACACGSQIGQPVMWPNWPTCLAELPTVQQTGQLQRPVMLRFHSMHSEAFATETTAIYQHELVRGITDLVTRSLSIRSWWTPPPQSTPPKGFRVVCLAAAQGRFAHCVLPLRARCQLVCIAWALPRADWHFHMLASVSQLNSGGTK
jgi:hypothetical protein